MSLLPADSLTPPSPPRLPGPSGVLLPVMSRQTQMIQGSQQQHAEVDFSVHTQMLLPDLPWYFITLEADRLGREVETGQWVDKNQSNEVHRPFYVRKKKPLCFLPCHPTCLLWIYTFLLSLLSSTLIFLPLSSYPATLSSSQPCPTFYSCIIYFLRIWKYGMVGGIQHIIKFLPLPQVIEAPS